VTEAWDASIPELEAALKSNELFSSSSGGDKKTLVETLNYAEKEELPNEGIVYCGQGIGEIDSLDPVYDIIQKIEADAIQSLSNLSNLIS
jgi:NAD(P)H-dependent flavin oxidoreductase YrpB (nitropropane dioxygenase family)